MQFYKHLYFTRVNQGKLQKLEPLLFKILASVREWTLRATWATIAAPTSRMRTDAVICNWKRLKPIFDKFRNKLHLNSHSGFTKIPENCGFLPYLFLKENNVQNDFSRYYSKFQFSVAWIKVMYFCPFAKQNSWSFLRNITDDNLTLF